MTGRTSGEAWRGWAPAPGGPYRYPGAEEPTAELPTASSGTGPPPPPGTPPASPVPPPRPGWWRRRSRGTRWALISAGAVVLLLVWCTGLLSMVALMGGLDDTAEPEGAPAAEVRTVTKTEPIPFSRTTVEDPALPEGTREIRTKGQPGVRTVTYEVTISDGQETDRRLVGQKVTREPVTQVTAIGTGPAEEPPAEPPGEPAEPAPPPAPEPPSDTEPAEPEPPDRGSPEAEPPDREPPGPDDRSGPDRDDPGQEPERSDPDRGPDRPDQRQRAEPPEPEPEPTDESGPGDEDSGPECDPNYTGCVPIADDVDCAGGSGDGPEYVDGPVEVVGDDVYDLDRNGDGTACE